MVPRKISISRSLEPVNATLHGNSFFGEEIVKDFEMEIFSCVIRVGPQCNHMCPYKSETWRFDTHRREGIVKKEAETGVRQPPEPGKGKEQLLSRSLWRECSPASNFISAQCN